jgi:hypothetical protein
MSKDPSSSTITETKRITIVSKFLKQYQKLISMKGSAAFISISSEFRPKDYPNYPNGVLLLEKMTMGLCTNSRGDRTSDQDVSDVRNIIDLDLPFE